jgi:hypothetical protein
MHEGAHVAAERRDLAYQARGYETVAFVRG